MRNRMPASGRCPEKWPDLLRQHRIIPWHAGGCLSAVCMLQNAGRSAAAPPVFGIESDEKFTRHRTDAFVRCCLKRKWSGVCTCGDGPPCRRIRYKTAAIESRGRSVLRRAPISMPGPAAGKPSAVLFLRARRKNVENLAYGGRERRRGGWHIRVSARVQAGIPGGWISPDPAAQGHKQWKGERP